MTSAMPTVDLVRSLDAAADQARERSTERDDAFDQLAHACAQVRTRITGANRTGGDPSRQVERDAVEAATAEQLRAELATLSHDRSADRARAVTQRLAEFDQQLG